MARRFKHKWHYVSFVYGSWTECTCGYRPDNQDEYDAHTEEHSMKFRARLKRWTRKRRHGGGQPVPLSMFRMVTLNDNPYPDYVGWRAWCSGKPYWDNKDCECSHKEKPYGATALD